ncbi:MAG: SRPBCC family protein [Chloroflexota bacterium]|nr:SRPBCC family protein [Anaerolineae bacterium]
MPTLHFSTTINAPPKAVFNRIADFAHYDNWLEPSPHYNSTLEIADNPVRLGTTYVDKGRNSTMYGEVTVCRSPEKIAFHQVTHLKLLRLIPAGLDITIAYQLKANGTGTDLERDVSLQANGVLKWFQSRLLSGIAAESQRILEALKLGLE